MTDRRRNTIDPARVDQHFFESVLDQKKPKPEKVETPGVDPVKIAEESLSIKTKLIMKLKDSKIARFLAGETKVSRIIFSVIDVLPVPNVHEVIKGVLKDLREQAENVPVFTVLQEIFRRLDWVRTIVAVIAAVLLVRAINWADLPPELFIELIRAVTKLF